MTTHVDWDALTRAQQRQLYPRLVRQIFSHAAPLSAAEKQAIVPAAMGPESIQIEITTWCNLKCRECGRTKAMTEGTWVNGHIALDDYASILAKLPETRRIILQGVGEPTMHPHFVDLVRLAAETGKFEWIVFNTNGHPHKDDFWIDLAARYRCAPTLSIDSLDPVIAERCRALTNTDLLFARLKLFRSIFQNFAVTLVASKLNLDDIEQTIARVGELGPGVFAIQNVITEDAEVALDADAEAIIAAIVTRSRVAYPELKIHWETVSSGLTRCVAPFLAPFVTLEGFVTPCCAAIEPSHYGWTSLLNPGTWESAYGSAGVSKWIEDYFVEDPAPCRGCPFNPARSEMTSDGQHEHFQKKAEPR